jgi:hypothetical protein
VCRPPQHCNGNVCRPPQRCNGNVCRPPQLCNGNVCRPPQHCNGYLAPLECGRGSILSKPKTIKLVFAASTLSMQY